MIVEIAGQEFELVKRGITQAEQITRLGQWLSKYGAGIMEAFSGRGELEEDDFASAFQFLGQLLGSLDANALIEAYQILIGCERGFAEEYFDIFDLVDVAIKLYQEHPAIRRLLDRFFSTTSSLPESEDSSTISELPMDGPTT